MTERVRLIMWDAALIIGIILFLFLSIQPHNNLIVGLISILIFSNCVANHITVYKLTGKLY